MATDTAPEHPSKAKDNPMETLVISMAVCLIVLCFGIMSLFAWRELEHKKQIDELTTKIISRTAGEYASAENIKKAGAPQRETTKPKTSDPVLGAVY